MLITANRERVEPSYITNKRIVMFGASSRNKEAINELNIQDNVLFVVDSDSDKAGQVLDGYNICSLDSLYKENDFIVLSVLAYHCEDVLETLSDYGINNCLFYYKESFDIENVIINNNITLESDHEFKYIHIFINDKFMIPFYLMIEDAFNIKEHLFILDYVIKGDFSGVAGFSEKKNKEHGNILILDGVHGYTKNGKKLVPDELNCNKIFHSGQLQNIYNTVDKIVLHSAFWWSAEMKEFIYRLVQAVGEKMVWICFGGDSYYTGDDPIVVDVLRKIKYSYATPADGKRIRENYKIPVGEINASLYCYITQSISKEVVEKSNEDKCVNILLGHSAAVYGNHIYGMKLLETYGNENIKVYCPLSYGDVKYKKDVIENGKKVFGDKFIPMLDFIEVEKYYDFLRRIDVAVLPMTRMAAGTTLTYLSTIGKKIYMREDICRDFEIHGIYAENIECIRAQTFEEFIASPDRIENEDGKLKLNEQIVLEWKKRLED